MSQVFYRKYRPSAFKELVGQDHIKNILTESILQDRISHAYLFCGPRGTGKTTVARLMAKAVNCTNFDKLGDVCNECEYCRAINAQSALDIIEMDAASNRGIDEIRSLKDSINYVPNFTKFKVFIIDEAHMLTKDAFNALLKTLEEPPEHVKFIMATTEPHKIPVTILSRVQRYDFKLASKNELSSKLSKIFEAEGTKVKDDVLDLLYKHSGGSYRDAESILSKVLGSANQNITVELIYSLLGIQKDENIGNFINALANSDKIEALNILDSFISNSADLSVVIDQTLDRLRDLIIENINSEKLDTPRYLTIINELIDIKRKMKIINDKILVFQVGVVKICSRESQIRNSKLEAPKSNPKSPVPSSKKSEEKPSAVSLQPSANESEPNEEVAFEDEEEAILEPITTELEKEIMVTTGADLSGFYDFLITKFKQEKPRIVMILESCDYSLEGELLVIHCDSKFNCEYLEKNLRDLSAAANQFNSNIKKVTCRLVNNQEVIVAAPRSVSDNSEVVEDLL